MKKFYSSKTLLKMVGGGMHTQHIPQATSLNGSAPGCVITKDGLKFYERCSKPEIPKAVEARLLYGSQKIAFWWNW